MAVVLFIAWWKRGEGKAGSWRELSGLFEKLAEREIAASHRLQDARTVTIADLNEPPQKGWTLYSADKDCQRDAESLCGRAGALLLGSAKVVGTLSRQVKAAQNDADRWLYFLKDIREATSGDARFVMNSFKDGKHQPTMYSLSVENVSKASVRGCTECLRREQE